MPEQNIERRFISGSQIRSETVDGSPRIKGYVAVFNRWSGDLGGFKEKIDPGAFAGTIMKDDIRALWNHDEKFVFGRNRSGTLILAEDQNGLVADINPPDSQWARDAMVSIERGDVTGMSFAFRTISDVWNDDSTGGLTRTLREVELLDVSPVTYPAYPDTTVALRSKNIFLAQSAETDEESQEPTEIVFPNLVKAKMRMIQSRMERNR
ncbi:HK97 family phage prohead protease [Patescibacteria group bacterium]|nr:HK97 family phage prohead protease [Patescibacteria group bacterium]